MVILEDCAPPQQKDFLCIGGGRDVLVTRVDNTDGHTGVEYEVIAKLAIRPRIEQVTVALVRLREASWRRHYVIHVDGRPGMGRILGALLGAKSFEGCPVVGGCLYAVVLSCGPGEREPRQDAIKGWFQNLVFAVDEASRQWVKALEAWEAGRAALLPTGLVAPPLAEVLEKFQPEPGQRVQLPEELWGYQSGFGS